MKFLVRVFVIFLPMCFGSVENDRDQRNPKLIQMFHTKKGFVDQDQLEEAMLDTNYFNSGINEAFLDLSIDVEDAKEEESSTKQPLKTVNFQESNVKKEDSFTKKRVRDKERQGLVVSQKIPRLRSSNVFQRWERPS